MKDFKSVGKTVEGNEGGNFNITRRVAVYNTRTDKLLLEVIGNLSVQKSSGDIDIIVERWTARSAHA